MFVLLSAAHPEVGWLVAATLVGVCLFLLYATAVGLSHGVPASREESTVQSLDGRLPTALGPLFGSILLGQVTVMVDNAFATHTGVGGVQEFVLASNLLAVPQNVIGGAVATVFFPLYGALWADGRKEAALDTLRKSARLVVYGLLPAVIIFVMIGQTIVQLIYQHGAFSQAMTSAVAHSAAALALGQVAYAGTVLLRQFLLVAGAPWAVLEGATVFLLSKWLGNLALTAHLGVPGIALASSFAALSTCAYLAVRVIRVARRAAPPVA